MRTMIHAAVFTAVLIAAPALAGVITIDFEDQLPVDFAFDNLVTEGFQFSPSHHYQIVPPTSGPDVHNYPSQWLGWDASCGTCDQTHNPNYTGIPPSGTSAMWVNYFGKSFSLQSLIPLALFGGDWTVTSSKGGSFFASCCEVGQPQPVIDFSGPQWTDITWLLFDVESDGGYAHGFDNITFRVPEPATALLVVGGLAFLSATRRKRRLL